MPLTDQIKNYAKKLVENRPDPSTLRTLVRSRKPLALRFRDDSIVPNNPHFPVLVYRGVVALNASTFDPATLIDAIRDTWMGQVMARYRLRLRPLPFANP
jgi:hypothetical protein